jgi:hypothetical protein
VPTYKHSFRSELSLPSLPFLTVFALPDCRIVFCLGPNSMGFFYVHGSVHLNYIYIYIYTEGAKKIYFGGLRVACWPLVPKFACSNPVEAVGFFRAKKNPQHDFLRKGRKAVGPRS